MKSIYPKTQLVGLLFGLVCIAAVQANTTATHDQIVPKPSESAANAIPFDQLGATAEKQYSGDGLSVLATPDGARMRCIFQRMEGRATAEGLWLHSTSDGATGEPFRVKAVAVGRQAVEKTSNSQLSTANVKLVAAGKVEVAGKQVRYVRPGLVEEYSVSMDGVRQDFVVAERPAGEGQLCVALAVDGAKAVQLAQGARLILDDGGRAIAYYRFQVADAAGKGLPAKLQVLQNARLAVSVDDAEAVYPVRIDPTFSDENWISVGGLPGADGRVHAAVVDGLGNLYIGGDFANVGNAAANRIAKWDGTTWSALGLGMDNTVHALAAVGNELYAGGHFQSAGDIAANYIAKWDGSHWSALGSGMDRAVFALVASGGDLYAGGSFTNAGGVTANCVAKWNGNNWTGLGAGIGGYYPVVLALAVSGHNLYAGGYFWTAGGSEAKHVAKWDGSTWSALGSGTGGSYPSVHALAVLGEDLFVGGEFTTAGGHAIGGIAKWNDTTGWSALTASIVKVYALAVVGIDLYAGGAFWSVDGVFATRYIAKWNGSSWSALGNGMEGAVLALASSGGDLYAGGEFYTSDRTLPKYIAKWDGNTWSAPGAGLSGSVQALAVSGSDLYVGGYFSTVGSLPASGIARWNGSGWSALGTNPPIYSVTALAVSGDVLFAAGSGSANENGSTLAKWDGSAWSVLDSDMYGGVAALAVLGNELYAGGTIRHADGVWLNGIAKWDGTNWSAVGSGMAYSSPHNYDPYVKALAVSGSNLYAGGSFDTAGGVVVNNIAKWDGQTWSPLGAGLNGGVFALASSGGDLYAGGALFIGGPSVVKWDGSSWSTLGSGMGGATPYIYALALSGGDLYAGGWFTMADGKPASGVAKWDGKTWLGLGSGLGGDVNALAVSGGYLYAGGDFTFAGGKPSPFVAKAIIGYHEPRISADPTDQTTAVGSRTSFFVGATGAAPISHQWRFNQENLADGGRISGAGSDCLTIAGIQTSDTGNYTVVVTNAYGSVTSRVAVLTVLETSPPYLLLDYYYPIYVGNEWLYDGTDWDGNVAQTLVQLDAVSMPVTCYRGESSPVAYSTNLTRLYSAYGASTPGGGFDANDTWYDYVLATGGWGMWGNDDDPGEEEVRVDGGLFFADPVVLGGVYAKTNDAYVNGDYVGPASMRMEVLSQTSVTVPAGTFPDCLHLRFTMAPPGDGPQMYEEWWAKGMGMVKHRGLSGAGANEQQDLIRATVTNPHTPPTLGIGQSNGQPQLRVSGTLGSRYALEYTASLVPGSQWQGLVTNTLTSDPLTVPLNIPEGEAQRFYRVRWVP